MHIVHFQPSVLLGSHQSRSHIVVISQVPSCHPFYALLALMSRQSWMSTLLDVSPLTSHITMVYHPSECCLRSCKWSIQFGSERSPRLAILSLTLGFEKVLFPFWAFARVRGPRRSSDEAQNKQNHEAQFDSTSCYVTHAWKEKCHGWPMSLPPYKRLAVLLAMQSMHLSSFHVPFFHKSWNEIFLRGRVVTPRIMETLIKSLNLQLCHKVRENQVIKVWNQKSKIKEFKFEVKSFVTVDRLALSEIFQNLLDLNQTLLPKEICSSLLVLQVSKSTKIMQRCLWLAKGCHVCELPTGSIRGAYMDWRGKHICHVYRVFPVGYTSIRIGMTLGYE
jgi:hypothetical protein